MRIGWVFDSPDYVGGAELNRAALEKEAPDWAELVPMTESTLAAGMDAYIVHNCTKFRANRITAFGDAPVIKYVVDVWPTGDAKLRDWFLRKSAAVILVSPPLRDWLRWTIHVPVEYAPSGIDFDAFRAAAEQWGESRSGTLWLGRAWPGKGLRASMRWARANDVDMDVYGFGPTIAAAGTMYRGRALPQDVARIMAEHERFVHLPSAPDPCPRTVIEAWAAGCDLVTNENEGSLWWIQHNPDELPRAATRFWEIVERHI